MPYKDKEKQKEAQRDWVRQKRKEDRVVEPANVEPEYIILSDGQRHKVNHDPVVVPERVRISGGCSLSRQQFIQSMQACNRADQWRGNYTQEVRDRLHNTLLNINCTPQN